MKIEEIKTGDYVKVKKGIKAPDFEYQLMDDWQGKVTAIHQKEKLVDIEWDANTLLATPEKYLIDLVKGGYDYEIMTLEISDLERANRRDNSNQRREVKAILNTKLHWIDLFEDEEKSIEYGKIFQGVNMDSYTQVYQTWEDYLIKNLEFPFEVEVAEYERGGLRVGTKIKLLDIEDFDDMYGIFGIGKNGREAITYPICNLEATNKQSKNYELLRDYVIWFANR